MNAKEELLKLLEGKAKVKCAMIMYGDECDNVKKGIDLRVNYTEADFNNFLKQMDFNYDNGYGGQELFGTIWLVDGTWCSRGEYDGSEWWNYNQVPEIPAELMQLMINTKTTNN